MPDIIKHHIIAKLKNGKVKILSSHARKDLADKKLVSWKERMKGEGAKVIYLNNEGYDEARAWVECYNLTGRPPGV